MTVPLYTWKNCKSGQLYDIIYICAEEKKFERFYQDLFEKWNSSIICEADSDKKLFETPDKDSIPDSDKVSTSSVTSYMFRSTLNAF